MNTRFTSHSVTRLLAGAGALALLAGSAAFALSTSPEQQASSYATAFDENEKAELHVGIYDPQRAFQSYHGFHEFNSKMQELQREQAEAQQQGDQQRVMEIQNEMQQRQNETVQQFYSDVEGAIPDVAVKQDIRIVAMEVVWVAPDMDAPIDITADLIESMNQNAQPEQRDGMPGFPQ